MGPEAMPQISLGTAALVIFLACVAFVFLRGVTRMLLGSLVLGGSIWVGFIVWQKAPGWSIGWFGKPIDAISIGLPVVAFLATFFFSRTVIGFFLSPFRRPQEGESRSLIFRLVLAAIPTAFLWLTGATLVHHFGSIAEMTKPDGKSKPVEWKDAVAAVIPPDWLRKLDPLTDPSHLSLAKLIAAQPRTDLKAEIDPETGKPYPRAIVVDEPELRDLASDGRFSTLLRHPLLEKALNDPKVREAVQEQMNRR